jgi:hypothetical protein
MKSSSSSKLVESELPFPTISLESIRPSTVHPPISLKLTRHTGLQCVLHIARDSPRPDLIVSVLTITNTNTSDSINNFHFQATVPKVRICLIRSIGDKGKYVFCFVEHENQITKSIRE